MAISTTGRIRNFRTSGENSSQGHVLYNNNFIFQSSPDVFPTSFVVPEYSSTTGTFDYYVNSPNSIFIALARPSIILTYTANTEIITADTRILRVETDFHKIDRASYETYRNNSNNSNWDIIRTKIQNPFLTVSASTSAITSAHTITIISDQLVKPEGNNSEELFQDKCQYFMNHRFIFSGTGNTYSYTETFDSISGFSPFEYDNVFEVSTIGNKSIATSGPWSGNSVSGLFFTCITPPSKPIIEFPFPTGQTTFTPTFNFSNVEDGDSYRIQVTYTLSDTGFTDTSISGVSTYYFEKTLDSLEQISDSTTTFARDTSSSTTKKIRRYNVPIKGNSTFLYRIGNEKNIENIFDVNNYVVTWSDHATGSTSSDRFVTIYVDGRGDPKIDGGTTTSPSQSSKQSISGDEEII